ncbi:MAG: hypothetical protein DRG83_19885 [Deltaproteobacteria bacterium]|nr:MAG: hypothetical protein DRG83_19885 [Deltaproteobacteria bacterium]
MLFLLTAKVFGCSTIGHLHGGAFDRFWNKLPKVCKLIGLTALNSLDGLIILMRRWKRKWRNLITESPRYRLFILPDPIDKNFADQEFSRPFQAEEVTLLFVGAIGEGKGVPTLLQAMNRVVAKSPNVHLILLGPEEHSGDHNEMKKLASQLLPDGCYKFVGSVYDKRKIEFFSQSDVFVFPSNYESFGVVIAEAMAASRPIVCTPVGMAPEYLEHGVSALFVRRGDPDDLAEKIGWMISHPQEAIEMGEKARKIFEEKLSQDRIMIKLSRIYMTLLKSREEH